MWSCSTCLMIQKLQKLAYFSAKYQLFLSLCLRKHNDRKQQNNGELCNKK